MIVTTGHENVTNNHAIYEFQLQHVPFVIAGHEHVTCPDIKEGCLYLSCQG